MAFAAVVDAFLANLYINRHDEEKFCAQLTAVGADELNHALSVHHDGQVCTVLLKRVADRVFGPDWKSAMLKLLTKQRIGELTLASKRALLLALLRNDGSRVARSAAVMRLLVSTRGADLAALKAAVDASDDHYDVGFLMTSLEADDVAATLAHFTADAAAMLAARETEATRLLEAKAMIPAMTPAQLCHAATPFKLLSDIDDTLFVSLFDHSFPNGTTYPGLLALYNAMDAGCGHVHGLPVEQGEGNIVFLTARPEGVGGTFEDFTHRFLAKKGIKHATVLSGTLVTALGSSSSMAAKKFENFQNFISYYPERKFAFVGDSGQGDIIMGQQMLASEVRLSIALVLIHDIRDKSDAPRHTPEQRAVLRAEGIVLFDSYVDAACEAYACHLISSASLALVAAEAQREFESVAFAPSATAQKEARAHELCAAVARVTAILEQEAKQQADV